MNCTVQNPKKDLTYRRRCGRIRVSCLTITPSTSGLKGALRRRHLSALSWSMTTERAFLFASIALPSVQGYSVFDSAQSLRPKPETTEPPWKPDRQEWRHLPDRPGTTAGSDPFDVRASQARDGLLVPGSAQHHRDKPSARDRISFGRRGRRVTEKPYRPELYPPISEGGGAQGGSR